MTTAAWTLADAPDLSGRTAIVTGATAGIGYHTALGLAAKGADTVLASRDPAKAAAAVARIKAAHPAAMVRAAALDLADLASVRAFAAAWDGPCHVLVNNAGVMGFPTRRTTKDGFEAQIGVNYLAHFALTALLRPRLAPGARVVCVASLAHRRARLDLDDLQSQRAYRPMRAYARTKLAMLVFALELHRRARANGWDIAGIAAHPGWARTSIIASGPGQGAPGLQARVMEACFGLVAQSAADGALPSLYAATAPGAESGAYYGPAHWDERRGPPAQARIFPQALDKEAAARLWAMSEELTGTPFR